ncbi:MAG: alpha/beta hydrolase [Solirubrobacteraceae bacterium]
MSGELCFHSAGVRCAGVHLRGDGDEFCDEHGNRPCVVLAHGFGATMDSGLLGFAERFAHAGLDALAFDYRHFGASDGEPRQLISIRRQQQDYAAAIAHARSLEGVDAERIVVWGSSYSGGHVVPVAVGDGRVAAVIAQVPAMDGMATLINLVRYAGVGQLARLSVLALRDVASSLRGGPAVTVAAVGRPGSVAFMSTPDAESGMLAIAGSSWRNEVAARIGLQAGMYRPGLQADRLSCPILIQIADRDSVAPVEAAQDAAWRAPGRAEVRTYPVGHFDVYVGDAFERFVSDQLHFLSRHLSAASRRAPAGSSAVAGASPSAVAPAAR